jgi:putative PIG3 family NAD(P)H quinone oxidoreductase
VINMKAMIVENENLVLKEIEKPSVKDNEIRIKIMAIGVNRADLLQKKGKYPSPKGWPEWPGLEVAGVVDAMGEIAEQKGRFKIGDRVCALLGGGGYAEYVCAPEGMVMRVPKNLSFEQASTLPEAYATSYLNLFWEGHLKEGNTAFIPAGASGLASVAIPMAKAFKARVITSVLSDEIAEKIKPLGADVVINSSKYDVSEILKQEELNGTPVNMSMDCLSGETLGKSLPYMAEGGYWVVISTLAGTETNVMLRPLLTKGLHLVGSMLRNRTSEEKAKLLNELVERVWPKIENGEIKPSIYKVLPLEMANEALDILERGENVGKVVIKVCDE